MTDLQQILFEYVSARQGIESADIQEYRDASRCAELKRQQLHELLDDRGRQLLRDMLNETELCRVLEREAAFLDTLSLARELSGLVRG